MGVERHAPMTYAAKHDPSNAGMMTDDSENPLLDDPEFEQIKHQSLAFEKLFEMTANFESYVDHVQQFPNRFKDFANGRGFQPDSGFWR